MSQTTLPPDPIDEVLSDFFKSQMPKSWPVAPRISDPASLIADRTAPAFNRARFTLAASVAILLGACWMFSSSSRPTVERGRSTPGAPGILDQGSAKMPDEFKKPKQPMLN